MRASFLRHTIIAIGLVSAGPAVAAVLDKAVVIGKYYEQNGREFCRDINACAILFANVPAGKTLTVERVACQIRSLHVPLATVQMVSFKSAGEPFARLQPLAHDLVATQKFNTTFNHYSVLNHATRYPLTNSAPKIVTVLTSAVSGAETSMTCQIAGTLTP